jgi:DNA-binding HxlR family transcriptional regulator
MTANPPVNTPCDSGCPVRKAAEIIGHKWSTLIVRDLLTGKKRYSELARSLTGISPKVLSERLQELESNRLVTRTVYPTVPPTTDYELTELGKGLEGVIRAMHEFGLKLAGGAVPPYQAEATASSQPPAREHA